MLPIDVPRGSRRSQHALANARNCAVRMTSRSSLVARARRRSRRRRGACAARGAARRAPSARRSPRTRRRLPRETPEQNGTPVADAADRARDDRDRRGHAAGRARHVQAHGAEQQVRARPPVRMHARRDVRRRGLERQRRLRDGGQGGDGRAVRRDGGLRARPHVRLRDVSRVLRQPGQRVHRAEDGRAASR